MTKNANDLGLDVKPNAKTKQNVEESNNATVNSNKKTIVKPEKKLTQRKPKPKAKEKVLDNLEENINLIPVVESNSAVDINLSEPEKTAKPIKEKRVRSVGTRKKAVDGLKKDSQLESLSNEDSSEAISPKPVAKKTNPARKKTIKNNLPASDELNSLKPQHKNVVKLNEEETLNRTTVSEKKRDGFLDYDLPLNLNTVSSPHAVEASVLDLKEKDSALDVEPETATQTEALIEQTPTENKKSLIKKKSLFKASSGGRKIEAKASKKRNASQIFNEYLDDDDEEEDALDFLFNENENADAIPNADDAFDPEMHWEDQVNPLNSIQDALHFSDDKRENDDLDVQENEEDAPVAFAEFPHIDYSRREKTDSDLNKIGFKTKALVEEDEFYNNISEEEVEPFEETNEEDSSLDDGFKNLDDFETQNFQDIPNDDSFSAEIEASESDVDSLDDAEADYLDDDDDLTEDEEHELRSQDFKRGKRKMFVSVLPEEEVEVVLAEEGQVLEYYIEMLHQAKTTGNIYKGVINNIDVNLQAAFISYGAVKNGFLQIDEVHPEYFLSHYEPTRGRKFPPIQKVLKAGQEILVQVVKEPTGNKGAFLTSYLSIPGRFLVLTPGREQIGVSRKVDEDAERSRLRALLEGLNPGPGLGVIVRTVSMGASKLSLRSDLQFLKRLWKDVRTKGAEDEAPCLIYQEPDLASRAVRDYLTEEVCEVWVDDEQTAEHIRGMVELLYPRRASIVKLHRDYNLSIWERFNIQKQLDQIQSRDVILPSGGRLVFDQTEALMAIDINTAKSTGKSNFESTVLRANLEAAETIPRQLKLRDVGGQIVIDFIEMRDPNHWRTVEKTLRNAMKHDRARHDIGRISRFGLMEIVRQRLASSAISVSSEVCPHCVGTGMRRNLEWQALQAMRDINRQLRKAQANNQVKLIYQLEAELALYLLNHKRERLLDFERSYQVILELQPAPITIA